MLYCNYYINEEAKPFSLRSEMKHIHWVELTNKKRARLDFVIKKLKEKRFNMHFCEKEIVYVNLKMLFLYRKKGFFHRNGIIIYHLSCITKLIYMLQSSDK